jgi:hypothetical protein
LRVFYEKGQIVRQEADTNRDRRVDVWASFQNGQRVEQLEDQSYRGKISARYRFEGGQVVAQEQVADAEPPSIALPFASVEEELKNMASYGLSPFATNKTVAKREMESRSEIK